MTPTLSRSCRLVSSIAAAALFSITVGATADVEIGYYNSASSFEYVISQMPDLDQERWGQDALGGLPGDGKNYCVPTSMMNLAAYAASHGFPELLPGIGNWRTLEGYLEISEYLRLMGAMMLTDPSDGTTHDQAVFGMTLWLATSGRLVLDHGKAHQSWAPKVSNIGQAMHSGGIVATCYGRYDLLEEGSDAVFVGDRNGGHCTTVIHARANGSALTLNVRDPASGGTSKYSQSGYTVRQMNVRNLTVLRTNPLSTRLMTAVDYIPFTGQDQIALLDSIFVLRPKAMYDWVDLPQRRFRIRFPYPMNDGAPSEIIREVNLDPGRVIEDFVVSPMEDFVAIVSSLTGQPDQIGWFSLADDTYQAVGQLPHGSRALVDRFGTMYAASPARIYKYDRLGEDVLVETKPLPEPVRAMAFNDAEDQIVMYAPQTRTLVYGHPDFNAPVDRLPLPASIPLGETGEIAINPVDGSAWLHTADSPRLYHVVIREDDTVEIEFFTHPDVTTIEGFEFDDMGHLFVTGDGSVKEFRSMKDGTWELVEESISGMGGLPVLGRFSISRSNNAWDDATQSNPGWHDISSDEVEFGDLTLECIGDANGDFIVDVNDLLELLGNWGPCEDCMADFDFNQAVDVEDLLTLLGSWGSCN